MTRRLFASMVLVAIAIAGVIYFTVRENQSGLLTLEGKVTQVRLQQLNDGATLGIVDFELKNPSDVDFEVRAAEMSVLDREAEAKGELMSKAQAKTYLDYEKLAQPHPLFGAGEVVKTGSEATGMMVARFEAAPDDLRGKTFRVKFTSANGVVVQLIGKP